MDLSNGVIDVSSRCDLSLVARDIVEPDIEKSQKNIVLNLICMICMFLNPLDRMSDTTDSTTGADGCDQLPESAYTELESRPRVLTLRCFFFHAWLCTLSLAAYQESLLPVKQGVQTQQILFSRVMTPSPTPVRPGR